jgi:hypothetical protein
LTDGCFCSTLRASGFGAQPAVRADFGGNDMALQLLDPGKELLKKKDADRKAIGSQLVQGANPLRYLDKPVCYDAAIFVRYLLGTKIKTSDFPKVQHSTYAKVLGITPSSPHWDGKQSIPAGTAVAFYRLQTKSFIHAAISTGGHKVRAINGAMKLGDGWREVDLAKVLGTPDEDGFFDYDKAKVKVIISKY